MDIQMQGKCCRLRPASSKLHAVLTCVCTPYHGVRTSCTLVTSSVYMVLFDCTETIFLFCEHWSYSPRK